MIRNRCRAAGGAMCQAVEVTASGETKSAAGSPAGLAARRRGRAAVGRRLAAADLTCRSRRRGRFRNRKRARCRKPAPARRSCRSHRRRGDGAGCERNRRRDGSSRGAIRSRRPARRLRSRRPVPPPHNRRPVPGPRSSCRSRDRGETGGATGPFGPAPHTGHSKDRPARSRKRVPRLRSRKPAPVPRNSCHSCRHTNGQKGQTRWRWPSSWQPSRSPTSQVRVHDAS